MTTAIEGVRILLNSIKSNAERLTSANVAHEGNSIKLITKNAITEFEESLKEQQDLDIQQAKRAICSACFTLRNNGECNGAEQLADEFEYCEFMKLFLAEMKGE